MNGRQTQAQQWFLTLRDEICRAFEAIEQLYCASRPDLMPGQFTYTPWDREGGGGGMMGLMKGVVFEKVGVNASTVWGEFSPQFAKEIPGAEEDPHFWASGISVVAHMASPLIPAVHMNTRYITTQKAWFGGGTDLTPYYPDPEDTQDFHQTLQRTCDRYDPEYYPLFKKRCDEYFYLPHRQETRGVGGIFYDYLESGNWEQDFKFTQDVGRAFLETYSRIVQRHLQEPWTPEQRAYQLLRRGRYVEFNLLYDRGTRFGLMTNGNMEAVLMSMPPLVTWP